MLETDLASSWASYKAVIQHQLSSFTQHSSVFCFWFVYFKGRERERGESSYTGSFPKCPEQLGQGHVETKSKELHLGVPHWGQEPRYLEHHLLPPRCISRKLNQQHRVTRTWSRHSDNGLWQPKWWLTRLQQLPLLNVVNCEIHPCCMQKQLVFFHCYVVFYCVGLG